MYGMGWYGMVWYGLIWLVYTIVKVTHITPRFGADDDSESSGDEVKAAAMTTNTSQESEAAADAPIEATKPIEGRES